MDTLPIELHRQLLLHIPLTSLQQTCLVNKRLYSILACDIHFAKRHLQARRFRDRPGFSLGPRSNEESFVDMTQLKEPIYPLSYVAALLMLRMGDSIDYHLLGGAPTTPTKAVRILRLCHREDYANWVKTPFLPLFKWALKLQNEEVVLQLFEQPDDKNGQRGIGFCDGNIEVDGQLVVRMLAMRGFANVLRKVLADDRVDPCVNANEPVRMAALHGREECVKVLMDDGRADVRVQANYCAFSAVKMNHLGVLRQLAKDERVGFGDGLLRIAVQEGHLGVVEFLLQDGRCDPCELDNGALKTACGDGNTNAVRLLLADGRVNVGDDDCIALRMACGAGNVELVELLLETCGMGSPSAAYDALYRAIHGKHVDVVRTLLRDGRCDPAAHGSAAFLHACDVGNIEIIRMLLQDGRADAAADGNAAICVSANRGDDAVVGVLLEVETVDPTVDDGLALRAASENGHEGVVALLLASGRFSSSVLKETRELAVKNGHVSITRLFNDVL